MLTDLYRWVVANIEIAYDRRRALQDFSNLNDHMLLDIGLDRRTIYEHVHKTMPWQALERRAKAMVRGPIQGCG